MGKASRRVAKCGEVKTMNDHEYFEALCAAVAGGLALPEEVAELCEHLEVCEECRERLGDFTAMSAGILAARGEGKRRAPSGMSARFVARAATEGIPLRQPASFLPAWASGHPLAWTGAVAAGIMLLLLAFGNLQKIDNIASDQDKKLATSARPPASTTEEVNAGSHSISDDAVKRVQVELNAVLADKQHLARETSELNDQIKAELAHSSDLAAQIVSLQKQIDQLKQQSSAKDTQIADLNSEIKKNESVNGDELASLTESRLQNQDLRDQLAERDITIREQRQLLAAGSQARDLITARNLHIIDVHDNNGEGERQTAFGRIFYTEGKQIVFYAYDLDSAAKLKKQVAFYVWGGTLGNEHVVKNLGIFRNEDRGAGRWVLTFDDPQVLAEINTVFVTAESKKNVEKPDGKPILYAFLGAKPNHP